tara:strand:- start:22623 stop:23597 length:975 start_codon:yes stop_codon:yes gene_type:complete
MVNFHQIFNISDDLDFKKHCLKIFNFQYNNNVVYREFCNLIYKNPEKIKEVNEIPFLPISFFKTKKILSTNNYEKVFYSSGTSKKIRSKHYISRIELYEKSFLTNFIHNYGKPEEYNIIGLLPNYLENSNSSLIYMVEKLIKFSKSNNSGFYMRDFDKLSEKLIKLEKKKEKTILIGVSYALLDLISYKKFKLKNTIVMETGGMKGQRKEMVKSELHEKLKIGFGVSKIHSEYGMTELLSQAYSKGEGIFESPPWMKVIIRDINDAQNLNFNKTSGAINIIDLANINSCSFIATDDMGRYIDNSKFEVVGRIDNSDIRGCNLLI